MSQLRHRIAKPQHARLATGAVSSRDAAPTPAAPSMTTIEQDLRQRLSSIQSRLRASHPRTVSEGHREAARGDLWDDAQVATSLEDQTQSFARLTSEARQLTAALQRLSAGTYGQCEACEAPIPAGRLKALPTARLCVPCQERAERDGAARSSRIRIDYDFDDVLESSPA